MNENHPLGDDPKLSVREQHRFLLMVIGSTAVALLLTAVSLKLYASSGAAQLDLSRPGYEQAVDKKVKSTVFEGFPTFGPINQQTLKEFQDLYKKRADQATKVDSFGGDVMNDATLSIDAPPEQ
jgi:hypothetical protein